MGETIGNDFEIRAGTIKGSVRLAGYEYKDANVEFQPVFRSGTWALECCERDVVRGEPSIRRTRGIG
jgi:hypothetical protein